MFTSQWGRWLTPDPAGTKAIRLDDPQTWNMYAYARNNPTTLSDPSGLDPDPASPQHPPDSGSGADHPKGDPEKNDSELVAQQKSPAEMTSWQFFKEEVKGAWDATAGGMIDLVTSPIQDAKNIDTTADLAVTDPGKMVDAGKEAGHEVAQTVQAAASGDPHAIGAVVGTLAMVGYATKNFRADLYKSGGGGINLENTPTTGSRIGLDYNAWKGSGGPKPHVDITIKKPGVPFGAGRSGPGSNLTNIRHWPW